MRRRVKQYNRDAIISVSYRVNSGRAVKFRQWATRTLREHLTRRFGVRVKTIHFLLHSTHEISVSRLSFYSDPKSQISHAA
ncbi:MAG: RhuM family protein [Halioglobus sp.]|nr:RhuM family protein [Halioglobus sp.]